MRPCDVLQRVMVLMWMVLAWGCYGCSCYKYPDLLKDLFGHRKAAVEL